jgi:hypothetical protein
MPRLEIRRPWFLDIALHPRSELQEFYATGRCQNPNDVVCPYCLSIADSSDRPSIEEDSMDNIVECVFCEREFRVEASFGYGYSTYAVRCPNDCHDFVFSSQYFHQGKFIRILHCTRCELSDYHARDPRGIVPLEWKVEYDDPDYFDPEGILKAPGGFDRNKPTPILDAMRKYPSRKNDPYPEYAAAQWRYRQKAIEEAMKIHERVYNGSND